jgi:hypothetical protein
MSTAWKFTLTPALAAGLLTVTLLGCSSSDSAPEDQSSAGSSDQAAAPADNGQDAEIEANLAMLTPEQRQIAETQKTCPVSGEPLGSMGVPIPVEVQGQTVLVCCDGCDEQVKENPEKYLAKLKK